MKISRIVSTVALAICAFIAKATDYSQYYNDLPTPVAAVADFGFRADSIDITSLGAKGDGITLCTTAIQQAIDDMSARGGGRVAVPSGIWLTGPIELKSGVELHLCANAVLYFSPDKRLYADPNPRASRVRACISATRCRNIGITGAGTIDGNGAQWRPVKRGKVSDTEWSNFLRMGGKVTDDGKLWYPWQLKSGYPDIAATPEKQEKKRNDLFRIHHCEDVKLTGVTFQNAPKFHVHPFNSSNVIIDGITVRCPWNAQNGDAIDISDCHRVLIVNSIVDAGDDGLCMKSGSASKDTDINGCRDILIQDCTVYHAHGGFVIGSEDICGMERIVVRGCTFSGTDTGLRFKSAIGRGGITGDIYISDIMMTDIIAEAITFQCDYVDRPAGSTDDGKQPAQVHNVPEFTGIHISNVVCRGSRTGIKASGISGYNCVHGITIANSTIVYTDKATDIDPATASLALTEINFVADRH